MPVDQSGFWVPPDTVEPSEVKKPHPPGYIYQDSIPGATPKTPTELLAAYYSDRAKIRDWTDPKGVLCKQREMYQYHPRNIARPLGSAGLIGAWPRPGNLLAVRVPIYGLGFPRNPPKTAVEFRTRNTGGPSAGVCMQDILRGTFGSLEGADDMVLDRFQGKDLSFIIAWPEYPHKWYKIPTRREADGSPLVRSDLAQRVVASYAHYFSKVEDECLLPNELGFFNIALHQGRNARDDSLGVQFLQLHLVRLCDTVDGCWAAEIDIV